MADIDIYEREDLRLTLYLVDESGVPLDSDCTVKVIRGDGKYFDGDIWVAEETSLTMTTAISGLYTYTIPANKLAEGSYTALYDSDGNGGSMESIRILPFKYVSRYGGM